MKLQGARRQNNVTKLIETFEKHQHKEQLLEDMSQQQEINRLSEESQKLHEDMNQTEIFEFFENSAKHQCPDCNAFSEIWIIHCSSGRKLKYSRSPTTLQKTNGDFTSTPGFVILRCGYLIHSWCFQVEGSQLHSHLDADVTRVHLFMSIHIALRNEQLFHMRSFSQAGLFRDLSRPWPLWALLVVVLASSGLSPGIPELVGVSVILDTRMAFLGAGRSLCHARHPVGRSWVLV